MKYYQNGCIICFKASLIHCTKVPSYLNSFFQNSTIFRKSCEQSGPWGSFVGTGKTLTGVALIKYFCIVNQRFLEMNKDNNHYVVYCGPSNKSVDLVTGKLFTEGKQSKKYIYICMT